MLPARLDRYDPSMLDMICLAGEAGWARLSPANLQASPVPSLVPATPIALFLREHADAWRTLRTIDEEPPLGEDARHVLSVLRSRGASFFRDLASACGLDADQLRHAIGALVACGLVTSDGFCRVAGARVGGARDDRHSTIGAAPSPAAGRRSPQPAIS